MSGGILVTGARGLIGGVLARALKQAGHDVVATGRQAGNDEGYIAADLADAGAVGALFDRKPYTAVVHAAARLRGDDTQAYVRDNVVATRNLLNVARAAGTDHFIFCSTISVYSGDGPFTEESDAGATEVYGRTKREAERLCLASIRPAATILRLGGVHGYPRRDGVVHIMLGRAIRGEPVVVREADTSVTLSFIDDVVAGVLRLLSEPAAAASRVYNLACSEAPSYRELAEQIVALTGSKSPIAVGPAARKRNRVLDTTRIRRELGFAPSPLRQHLRKLADTLRA
jgi:nucleoside-diphosphate-sugar epimerase